MKFLVIGNYSNINEACQLHQTACEQISAAGHSAKTIMSQKGWQGASNRLQILIDMLLVSDALFLLPGWQQDALAQIVVIAANNLNLPVVPARDAILPERLTFFLKTKTNQHDVIGNE